MTVFVCSAQFCICSHTVVLCVCMSRAICNHIILPKITTDIIAHFYSQDARLLRSLVNKDTSPADEIGANYAELIFEGVQPIKPPPLECEVTYTEALAPGERIVSV